MADVDPRQFGSAPTKPTGVPFDVVEPAARDHWFPPVGAAAEASDTSAAQHSGSAVTGNAPSSPPIPGRPIPARPIRARAIAAQPSPVQPVAAEAVVVHSRPADSSATYGASQAMGVNGAQSGSPEDDAQTEDDDAVDAAARRAPPWLLSSLVHMLVLIIMGLLSTVEPKNKPAVIELDVYGESLGDDLFDASVEILAPPLEPELEAPALALVDLPEMIEPQLELPPAISLPQGASGERDLPAPAIGYALSGRDAARKKILLGKYGGDDETEKAVQRALAWLKRNQRPDGSWSLVGPYEGSALSENTVAATAMALLAFQGAGHTHQQGEYQPVVDKGWKYLLRQQNGDGVFTADSLPNSHFFYTHGQATIAVCEAYGMTKDSRFRAAAERAVQYCVRSQFPEGGWRYAIPRTEPDTSVTGWIVMALQSAKMAGIAVPQDCFESISRFLDTVAREGGSKYVYQARDSAVRDPTMTAEALLCRQYLGWKRDDKRLLDGVAYIVANPIDPNRRDVYYWYYATQVCHHMEGEAWNRWNAVMRKELPAMQIKSGPESGSWDPQHDFWGSQNAGRLYTTCLSTYSLEVYYRHLPLYSKVFEVDQQAVGGRR